MEAREKLWLLGPGRRSERTVFEQQLLLDNTECGAVRAHGQQLLSGLLRQFRVWRANASPLLVDYGWNESDPQQWLFGLYARLAIELQRAAGHRVSELGVLPDLQQQGCWVWFEYEHDSVAAAASNLAWQTLADLLPALQPPEPLDTHVDGMQAGYEGFMALAQPLVLPADTEAFIAAARARDIPCVKLDRAPYEGVKGDFRIRDNSLLKLGHGARHLVLDGSICISRSARLMPLLRDSTTRRRHLAALQLPVAGTGPQAGREWQVLLLGREVLALLCEGRVADSARIHPGTQQMAMRIAASLGSDLLLLRLHAVDLDQDLRESGGVFVDFDIAPRLDELFRDNPELLAAAAGAFMDRLVPDAAEFRIPIVTVTGTNGKTTTCRMIEAIARESGLGTGMACTGANYINGELVPWNERLGSGRQFRLLDKAEVQLAVLEEYLGTIIGTGFAYQHSDVAVCCNVTEDHLGRLNFYNEEHLADAKLLAVKRAQKAAVLNADNHHSLAMMRSCPAQRIGLVSLRGTVGKVRAKLDRPGAVCVLEQQHGENWLVLYEGEKRLPLVPEKDLPASFNGMARHNTDNAMHAALATYLLGIEPTVIAAALRKFHTDFASSPGRLNLLDGLPFRFIMDYAHNIDGFRVLCDFVDQMPVKGRKMLCLAFAGDRLDSDIQRACTYLARHFDYFICRRYRGLRGRGPEEIPRLAGSFLQAAGVPAESVQLEVDPGSAIQSALDAAKPGDLLVVLSGSSEFQHIWNQAVAQRDRLTGEPST